MSYLIDQRQLLFWQKMLTSDNVVYAMSRLIVNQFIAIGSRYGITSYRTLSNMLQLKVWDSFALAVMDSI